MLGLIGCGQIFHDCYLAAFDFLKVGDIIAFDQSPDAMQRAVRESEHCKGINICIAENIINVTLNSTMIIVLVPPASLLTVVKEIAGSKKEGQISMLVEKPMGVSFAEAKEITEICMRNGIKLHYMEVFLHSSTTDVLIEELSIIRGGNLKSIEMQFKGGLPNDITSQWRGDRAKGGHVWHDWGIHSLGMLIPILKQCRLNLPTLSVIRVTDAIFQEINGQKFLMESKISWKENGVDVSVLASWMRGGNPDMRITFENGTSFEVIIGKIKGISSWSLLENNSGTITNLASSRYPKERFIRGIRSFISGNAEWAFDPQIALHAMLIADYAYENSWR